MEKSEKLRLGEQNARRRRGFFVLSLVLFVVILVYVIWEILSPVPVVVNPDKIESVTPDDIALPPSGNPTNVCVSHELDGPSLYAPSSLIPHGPEQRSVIQPVTYSEYTLCVPPHPHHHRLALSLTPIKPTNGNVDFYIGTTPHPTTTTSTWISRDKGADSISIPTYSEDFRGEVRTLYVSVYNPTDVAVEYTIQGDVVDVSDEEMLARGSLRGGRRVMPGEAPGAMRASKKGEENGYAV